MDIGEVKRFLGMCPEQPVLLIGPPGIGKTQVVNEFAQEKGRKLYTIVLSHLDIDDLKGIPYITSEGKLEIKKGPLIPDEDEEAVIFLDEITTVNQQKLAIALKIIDERKVGYFSFSKTWVIAAGNPPEWHGLSLDSRVVSRCVVVNVMTSVESFTNYLINRYKGVAIAAMVSAFLHFDKRMLLDKPKEIGDAFATPRGYEKLVRRFKEFNREDLLRAINKDTVLVEGVLGSIGRPVGAQFLDYIKLYEKLPAIENVLAGKEVKIEKIKDIGIGYAVTMALVYGVKEKKQVPWVWNFIKEYVLAKDCLVTAAKVLLKQGFELGSLIRDVKVEELLV